MQKISTIIRREWFQKIVDGKKRTECRQIKPYWTKRLRRVTTPFRLTLRNGMRPPVPVVEVKIASIVPSPHGKKRHGYYELRIDRILRITNWPKSRIKRAAAQ